VEAKFHDEPVPRVCFTPPNCVRLGLLLASSLLAAGPLRADEPLAGAWRFLAGQQLVEAGLALKSAAESDPRERELAQAVLLVAQQPVTDLRLAEAERRLQALATVADETGAAAQYFAGRLHQLHFAKPDHRRAADYYRALAVRQPASHWAQLAQVKLALLTLYMLPEPAAPAARLAAVEAMLPGMTIPRLRRDLLIVLGRSRLFYDEPVERALADLVAAADIGGLTGIAEGQFLLQVAELSFRTGRDEQARDFFVRYLRDNEADPRSFTARERLREIDERRAGAAQEAGS
jgi:hypothetical protein